MSMGDGLLLTLRGVNLNPGADPEDMVALRLWVEPDRVISIRHRPVMAVNDLRERLASGRGLESASQPVVLNCAKSPARIFLACDDGHGISRGFFPLPQGV